MSALLKIGSMFLENRGKWIPLPTLTARWPAQYSKRLSDLRRCGLNIENRKRQVLRGGRWVTLSEYRLS